MTGDAPSQSDASSAQRLFEDRDLIVVSNRQPYSHGYSDDGIEVSRPAGGLTAALDPVVQDVGGTWVAWGDGDADREVVDDADRVRVPPDDPAYDLRRVWLDEEAIDGYYYGFSNQELWPLAHSLPSKVSFEGEYWAWYRQVNEQFAEAVVEEADRHDDPLIWFHDYHFGLAPGMIRRRLDAATLRIPLVGFLPIDDERVQGTIEAVRERLTTEEGFVDRYRSADGLPGEEGAFLLTTLWLVECLARSGRREEAERIFENVLSVASPHACSPRRSTPRAASYAGTTRRPSAISG